MKSVQVCTLALILLTCYTLLQTRKVEQFKPNNVHLSLQPKHRGHMINLEPGTYVEAWAHGQSVKFSPGLELVFDVHQGKQLDQRYMRGKRVGPKHYEFTWNPRGEYVISEKGTLQDMFGKTYAHVGPVKRTVKTIRTQEIANLNSVLGGTGFLREVKKLDNPENPAPKNPYVELYSKTNYQGQMSKIEMRNETFMKIVPQLNYESINVGAGRRVKLICHDDSLQLVGPFKVPKMRSNLTRVVVTEQVSPPAKPTDQSIGRVDQEAITDAVTDFTMELKQALEQI